MANQPAGGEGRLGGDTIAAAATAAGQAAIGIVRISGRRALEIAEKACRKSLTPRRAEFCRFRAADGELIDEGIALYFPGPASFTGEDVVELQCHGSPVVIDWLLETVCAQGARPAQAGEFSLRAFLNDKLDLTQAEAIADLIASGSRAAVKAAGRSLAGRFSARVSELQQELTALRVLCESWLDFPDEDIDHAANDELERRWRSLGRAIDEVLHEASHGRKLSDGLHVAIAGLPNAGKSSLLNCLAGSDAAIVTEQPGTTRDTIRETVDLGGVSLTLVDMAGLRETEDLIEGEGIRRARAEIADADHVLWVADIRDGIESAQINARRAIPASTPFSILLNKIDLVDGEPVRFEDGGAVLALSARSGAGTEAVVRHLKQVAGLDEAVESAFSARRRHVDALASARERIAAAGPLLTTQLELAAEELKAAQSHLDELTGEHTSDDLLGEIFSSFCIGK
ncbi:MAG TPA: tRNA uridine-5-carboxymethylaminomethyl(34) synthesis GTPase MnmE [Gammaproteobacteria bacterium]|nr:tRNA uridine-5-carboxymethylaminomethyl(34) synthesis GTPase MnmE [Gammaproteobacteria bacterium]